MGLSLERDVWRYSLTGFSKMTNLSLDWGMVDETGDRLLLRGVYMASNFCSQVKIARTLWVAELYLVTLYTKLGDRVALVYA